ncbi:MAG: sterol desaturase family protein [Pseudomonadota bacterium]
MIDVLTHEAPLRLTVFLGMLALMIGAEAVFPRKTRTQPRRTRWATNAALVVVDTLALRLALPLLAVAAAVIAEDRGWGIFNVLAAPAWLEWIAAFLLLDLALWAQHVATHRVPALWALHKVHHADRDLDATSGLRFHPVEIVLSMIYKIAVVAALGAPAEVVVLFEIALNAAAIFNHANVRLPKAVDAALRTLIVTPDFHRVHHSTRPEETNSNYGFFLSVWDRLFRVYRAEPAGGHDAMRLGLAEHQTDQPSQLLWCLIAPITTSKRGREAAVQ